MTIDFSSDEQMGLLMGLIAVSRGLLIALTAVVGHFFVDFRRLQVEGELKMQMLERGMSADEIKVVLETPMSTRSVHGCSARSRLREANRINT
jgi:hypothetical protein